MPCTHIKLGEGMHAIVCTRGVRRPKLCGCERVATLLCDWKIGGKKTCDAPLCPQCAQEVGPEKHLCAEHAKAFDAWLAHYAEVK